ncbi:MAG TPA: hypothetical protein VFY94_01390 [Rhodanobacteraceae bacterium]|jgi:hypothetical protein|nr:hypothetical protein [Rhodanobacteraceae bacterium]
MKKFSVFMMFMMVLAVGVVTPAHACLFAVPLGQVHPDCGGTPGPIPISATIELDTVFAGNTPDGTAPWLTATFASTRGESTGTLTLTSNLGASDFLQGLGSSDANVGWAFYLGPSLASISCTSGVCADNNALFGGSYSAGLVPGTFNMAFGWSSGNRFDGADVAVYTLTFTQALTGNPFAANGSGWWSVAHVQGLTGGCSGWIVSGDGRGANGSGVCTNTPPIGVPEPAGLGVFGVGVMMIGCFLGLRRRMT